MPTVSFTTSGALGKSALRQANERLALRFGAAQARYFPRRYRSPNWLIADVGDVRGEPVDREPADPSKSVSKGAACRPGAPSTALHVVADAIKVGVEGSASRRRG